MASADLCTVQDVRDFLQKPTVDVNQDPMIAALITAVSKTIANYTDREFAPTSTAVLRTFETEITNYPSFLSLAPYDMQAAGTTPVVQIDTDQASPVTLSTDEYRFFPVTKPDGVYTSVRLQPLTWPHGRISYPERQIKITADWGFPAIPDDVKQAAVMTTAIWLRRDVSAFSTTFNLAEDHIERPEALPSAVRALLGSYVRMSY